MGSAARAAVRAERAALVSLEVVYRVRCDGCAEHLRDGLAGYDPVLVKADARSAGWRERRSPPNVGGARWFCPACAASGVARCRACWHVVRKIDRKAAGRDALRLHGYKHADGCAWVALYGEGS